MIESDKRRGRRGSHQTPHEVLLQGITSCIVNGTPSVSSLSEENDGPRAACRKGKEVGMKLVFPNAQDDEHRDVICRSRQRQSNKDESPPQSPETAPTLEVIPKATPAKWRILRNRRPFDAGDRQMFLYHATRLVQEDPSVARVKIAFDNYFEEYLLFRVLCFDPPLSLLELIYRAHPAAIRIRNDSHKSVLHRACQFHCNSAVVRFLIEVGPGSSLFAEPSPLFLAIHPLTPPGVLELLIQANKLALTVRSDGRFTPLDYALMEGLSVPSVQLMLSLYPLKTLKINMMECSRPVLPEVAALFAEHFALSLTITTLDISKLRMTTEGLCAFLTTMAKNNTILKVVVDFTTIACTPDLCDSLEYFLTENETLSSLVIKTADDVSLDPILALALECGIQRNVGLDSLTIDGRLPAQSWTDLLAMLEKKRSINKLAFHKRDREQVDWSALSKFVHLVELDLTGSAVLYADDGNDTTDLERISPRQDHENNTKNKRPPRRNTSFIMTITTLIETTHALCSLTLADNHLDNVAATELAYALLLNSSIQEMDVRNNPKISNWSALVVVLADDNCTLQKFRHDTTAETPTIEYYTQLNETGRTAPAAIKVELNRAATASRRADVNRRGSADPTTLNSYVPQREPRRQVKKLNKFEERYPMLRAAQTTAHRMQAVASIQCRDLVREQQKEKFNRRRQEQQRRSEGHGHDRDRHGTRR